MKLALFYHVYPGGDWEYIFQEQIGALHLSGLWYELDHIHIGLNGSIDSLPETVREYAVENENKKEETDTMRSLDAYCWENPDACVLYLHTKGASRKSRYTEDWRHLLEYFCIQHWRECVKALEDHEVAGALWQEDTSMGHWPHFSGTFWWARASYVAVNCDNTYFDHPNRYMREFWIGSGKPKVKNFWESNLNKRDKAMHYTQPYDRKIYSKNYLTDQTMLTLPDWDHPNKDMVKVLNDLDINGTTKEGGTDKATLHNYTGIYSYLLEKFRDKKGRLLEIGVQHGGSSLLWHEYLPHFYLDLVDQKDEVPDKIWHNLDPTRYDYYTCDAYHKSAVETLSKNLYDIIIDDGPHTLRSQQYVVHHYYPLLKSGGVMTIESIQDVNYLDVLTDCIPEDDRDGIRIFDVRETQGRYDDLIWSIVKQ